MQLSPRLDIPVSPGQRLAGRTTIDVFARVVDEILLAEPAVRLGAWGQRLRNERRHARRLAGQNLFAFEVAGVPSFILSGAPKPPSCKMKQGAAVRATSPLGGEAYS